MFRTTSKTCATVDVAHLSTSTNALICQMSKRIYHLYLLGTWRDSWRLLERPGTQRFGRLKLLSLNFGDLIEPLQKLVDIYIYNGISPLKICYDILFIWIIKPLPIKSARYPARNDKNWWLVSRYSMIFLLQKIIQD